MRLKIGNTATAIALLLLLGSCHPTRKMAHADGQAAAAPAPVALNDTTPKVTGIGGIFFYADSPKESKEWYSKNLGIDVNPWGSASFDYSPVGKPDDTISLQWKPFKQGDTYFSPSQKDFMINYTVQNLEGLVRQLKANGVTLLDTMETYDYGKFIHIMDAEGRKIELWEPAQ